MSSTDKIISNFLLELHSDDVQSLFESLDTLLEHLENKSDPDPEEIQIVNSAYESLEKLKMLEGYLQLRIQGKTKGNKLQELYDKASTHVGMQSLFD